MHHTIAWLPKAECEIEVTLPFSEFEPHVKRAAGLLADEVEIEGFRRGKAPYEIVKKYLGEDRIYERAAELAVRATYPKITEEIATNPPAQSASEFSPLGAPDITVMKLAPQNDLVYKARLAFLPGVALPDYRAIARGLAGEKKEMAATDEEVAGTLTWIRESRLTLHDTDRPAQKGDAMEIDFEIRQGGVKLDSGQSRNHPLVLGNGTFMPGFEDALVGMKGGEEKSFTLTVPDDWKDKAVAGKTLDITATVKFVKERRIPELTNEFARGLGTFASVDALTQNIREGITTEKKEKERTRVRALIIEAIARDTTVDVPDILIERELDKMTEEMKEGIENMGMKWDDYMLHIKKTAPELKREWRSEAEKRVRIALTLREIARQEKIELTDEEVSARADEFLRRFKTPDKATEKIDPDRLREYTKGILKNEKVFEFLETL